MSDWISVSERLPEEPSADVVFESVLYLVTDGAEVWAEHFERGHGCGEPWADWNENGLDITHWMPLPAPPQEHES